MKLESSKLFTAADGLDSYLSRGLSATFLISLAGKGIAFVTGIVLARVMGPASLGVYALALAVAQLLQMPSALGLPGVVVRYVSLYDAERRWSLMRGLLTRAWQVTLVLSLGLAVAASVVVWLLSDRLGAEKTAAMLLAVWLIPLLDLAVFRTATLQGLRRIVLAQIPDALLRPMLLLGLLLVAWKVADVSRPGAVLVLQFHLMAAVVTFIVGLLILWRTVPQPVWMAPVASDYPRWRDSLIPFMFIHTTQLILNHTDTVLLGVLSTDASVGLYRVAWQTAGLMTFTLSIVNAVIQPMVSRLYSQSDQVRLQRMVTLTARLSVAITMPIAIVLLLFGAGLLSFVFGDSYRVAYPAMAILVSGQLVNVVAGSVGLLLFMTGHERDAAHAIGFAVALNVGLDVALIPAFGIEGAAVASAVSLAAWNVFLYLCVRKRLGIHPTAFGKHL